MRFNYLHPRDQLVEIMKRIYRNGMTTLSGGNLSILEDNGDMWITPAGIDKGKLRPEDIVLVHADGTSGGPHQPSTEYPFHRAIYRRRPDLRAVVHAHPPALVSFSIAREIPDTRIIPQANRVCGPVGYAPYALPGSEQLGENIAATFGEGNNVVLLENHGIATAGHDLLTAFQRLETLDFCARTLIAARRVGEITILSPEQLDLFDSRKHLLPEFIPALPSSCERELRKQIVEIVHRACERYLMISTEGVVSARLDGGDFLITPTGMDRQSLEVSDIVLIQGGGRESGKFPSRSVQLHQAIYDIHPDIHCIITAQSPHILAYAVATAKFDTRTIPESYLLLVDVPVIPFETLYQSPHKVAGMISEQSPVLLIRNDCVLTVGKTILQAFDRLEVAEFSAKSLLETETLGNLIPIKEEDIRLLQAKFLHKHQDTL
jgi:L-fuculose-phosphate aldolase